MFGKTSRFDFRCIVMRDCNLNLPVTTHHLANLHQSQTDYSPKGFTVLVSLRFIQCDVRLADNNNEKQTLDSCVSWHILHLCY